ncbi:hypothetical protein J6590_014536 [Homalodisca vitripennis]|nr:hypothetical protein J6590_014536 [Homalodisca vitripennis]
MLYGNRCHAGVGPCVYNSRHSPLFIRSRSKATSFLYSWALVSGPRPLRVSCPPVPSRRHLVVVVRNGIQLNPLTAEDALFRQDSVKVRQSVSLIVKMQER